MAHTLTPDYIVRWEAFAVPDEDFTAAAVSLTTIQVTFDWAITSSTIDATSDWTVVPTGVGATVSVTDVTIQSDTLVLLTVTPEMSPGQQYQITTTSAVAVPV